MKVLFGDGFSEKGLIAWLDPLYHHKTKSAAWNNCRITTVQINGHNTVLTENAKLEPEETVHEIAIKSRLSLLNVFNTSFTRCGI